MADPTTNMGILMRLKSRSELKMKHPADDLITVALEAADAFIESELAEARLDLPASPYPSVIVQAANNYAIADALQPLFNSGENKNEKVLYYRDEADKFLTSYIQTELDKKSINGNSNGSNPFSHSKSGRDTYRDLEDLI